MIMKKFEYKVEYRLDESDLNRLGKQGWELVHIQRDNATSKHWFYLKREIVV